MHKTKTQAEYRRRIGHAIAFINENIDRRIDLEAVASASHFSSFHFHRIFHAIVGETVNDHITRKRMETAANRLVCQPELSVTDISEQGGFSSSANFSKAFKLYFGLSPSQLRDPTYRNESKIGKIFSKYGKEFRSQDLYSQSVTKVVVFEADRLEEILMHVEIREIEEKVIAYMTAPRGYELDAIFATWDKITHWAKSVGIEDERTKRFAICHDNPMITPTKQCRYDACIEVGNSQTVTEPYTKTRIPSGKYAVAYFKGESDEVSRFYMELYSAWLPNSGFEPDNYPPVAHYLNDSREDGYVEMEIYIKVKPLVST